MRHIPVEPPPFFHRGPSPLARLAFFGLLSLALLFVDTRFRYLEGIRQRRGASSIRCSARRSCPARRWPASAATSRRSARSPTRTPTLKRQLGRAAPRPRRRSPSTQQENARLRALLDVRTRYAAAATAVEVLYTGRDPFAQKLFVDKGADAGIQPGEAVIDERRRRRPGHARVSRTWRK